MNLKNKIVATLEGVIRVPRVLALAMRFLFAILLMVALMSVVCEAVPANNQQGQQNQNQQQQNQQKNNAAGAQNAKNGQGNQNGP
ncbi:hypothetical protein TNCV_787251 [Trichonephila clavipes]|nr:hypothetical protein TNCV_787251 [Trichonephila clavipes]